MPAVTRTGRPRPAPGLPIAATLHAAVIAWLAFVAIQHVDIAPVAEQSVEVELRTAEEFEALARPQPPAPQPAPILAPAPPAPQPTVPAEPAPPVPAPAEPAPHADAPAETDGMVHPRRMLSQRVLTDPRSRGTLAMLPRLAPDERIEQLCGLEAMGQIHDWQKSFAPDRVTAYAMAETHLADHVLKADGAAFRSRRHWYALRFE